MGLYRKYLALMYATTSSGKITLIHIHYSGTLSMYEEVFRNDAARHKAKEAKAEH